MNRVVLWAAICVGTFLTFLAVTSPRKAHETCDLRESQPKPLMHSQTITKISSDEKPARSTTEEIMPEPEKPEAIPPAAEKMFEMKRFAVDEILAMPRAEQTRFFTKHQIQDPENFKRFRNVSALSVIERYLKGRFSGTLDGKDTQVWRMNLDIDGQVEERHFQGEIAVELLDKQEQALSRSHLRGPLDDHIRLVEEGERHSLLIQPSGPEGARLYQVFIGADNRQELAGNYYARNGEGKLQILGSFLLKRL